MSQLSRDCLALPLVDLVGFRPLCSFFVGLYVAPRSPRFIFVRTYIILFPSQLLIFVHILSQHSVFLRVSFIPKRPLPEPLADVVD